MVDISDDGRRVRGQLQSGIVRRRRWTTAEKGRVVAEAVAPGAVIAEVARRHDLAPQHLSNWIRAAKDGHFALPCEEGPGFVPAVVCPTPQAGKASRGGRAEPIEIVLGSVVVRIPAGAERRLVELVLRTLRRDRAIEQNARLHRLLRQANNALYGSKSERLSKLDPDQLALALEDIEQALAKSEAVVAKAAGTPPPSGDRRRRINRGALPAHLPRLHRTIAPDDTDCPCCRAPMQAIGEETAERLDVIPAQYRVIVTHRPKLVCRACEKISQAPAPDHLIRSGLPSEAMVASVLVAKYGWHLPLYRQAQMLATQGIDLDRSTLAFWVGYAAAELMPLYGRLKQALLGSAKLAVDETPVPVLDPGRGKTKTGYFWTLARDDRPWAGADPPAVVYTYAPGRGGEHLQALLATYRGIVQCDGYAPYKKLPADRIVIAFCWAHLRRKFFDIAKGGNAPIATEALARIAALYEIEAAIRGSNAEHRRAERQARSAPLVHAFRVFIDQQLARVSAKAEIAEALRYGLNHWHGLIRFLDDGRIELDTNIVERSMRPQALTRKNALFAGHDDGADNWAIVASLIETAKLNGVDPQRWLADVLGRLVNLWPNDRLDELMPWACRTDPQPADLAA